MKPSQLVHAGAFATGLACLPFAKAQFSPADIQAAVDATFGPWDTYNRDGRWNVYENIWSSQTGMTLDGVDAARLASGSYSPIYLSEAVLRATITGPATLHFSYLAGPSGYLGPGSWVYVKVGTGPETRLPIADHWLEGSVAVPAGSTVVTWFFSSYAAGPSFLDQVWTEDDPRPRVTSAAAVEVQQGSDASYQITTNKPCDAFEATALPAGLTLDPGTGLITGVPTGFGSSQAKLKASNAAGSHTLNVTFKVKPLFPSGSPVDLATALDGGSVSWSQESAASVRSWAGWATPLARDTVDAATFSLRTTPEESVTDSNWLKAEVQGPGTFSFWRRAALYPQEPGGLPADSVTMDLKINGLGNASILPGPVGTEWEQRTIRVPLGRYDFAFKVSHHNSSKGDVLVLFDQASMTAGPQSFSFQEWLEIAAAVYGTYAGGYPQEILTRDDEGDGLGLLVEYALGGSPGHDDATLLPEVGLIDHHLTMTVHKAPGTAGVEYTVQANKTIAANGWTTFGTEIIDEDQNVLIVRCKKSVTEEPTYHLRLRLRLDDSVGP